MSAWSCAVAESSSCNSSTGRAAPPRPCILSALRRSSELPQNRLAVLACTVCCPALSGTSTGLMTRLGWRPSAITLWPSGTGLRAAGVLTETPLSATAFSGARDDCSDCSVWELSSCSAAIPLPWGTVWARLWGVLLDAVLCSPFTPLPQTQFANHFAMTAYLSLSICAGVRALYWTGGQRGGRGGVEGGGGSFADVTPTPLPCCRGGLPTVVPGSAFSSWQLFSRTLQVAFQG